MAAATEDREVLYQEGRRVSRPVAALAIIFMGTLVGVDRTTGYAEPLSDDADLLFGGVACEYVDNSEGEDGDLEVMCYRSGIGRFLGTGFAQDDIGKPVFGLTDQDVGLEADSTHYVLVGHIVRYESATAVFTSFEVDPMSARTIQITDAGTLITATDVEGALAEIAEDIDDLSLTTNGKGASIIGIEDAATKITATTVEGALAEIAAELDDFQSVANGKGASKVAIEDAGTLITATTVEGALAEIAEDIDDLSLTTNGKGASIIGIEDSATKITATTVEGALAEIAAELDDFQSVANGKGASKVAIEDAGNHLVGTTVEAALAQVAPHAWFWTASRNGTGAPENIAHGLGRIPFVIVIPLDGHDGAGAPGDKFPTITEGVHTDTDVIVTCPAGGKYKIAAM